MTDTVSLAGVLRQRLSSAAPTYMLAVRAWTNPELIHLAHNTGHHALYLDLQHGALDVPIVASLLLTASALGLPALVRTPSLDAALIASVLDLGAAGVIVPDVETAVQAGQAAAAAHHPPKGRRSLGGARGFEQEANPLVVAMIESAVGVEAAELIAAVAGIDALMVGSQDLSASLRTAEAAPSLDEATQTVIDGGRKHGVPVIVAGMRDPAQAIDMVRRGASTCFSVGTDVGYTLQGARQQIALFSAAFKPTA